MYNDFIIVGPQHDPAGLRYAGDVREAMRPVKKHDAILVEKPVIAFEQDPMSVFVGESKPGGAVGQRIAVRLHGEIQRRAHAAACFEIPVCRQRLGRSVDDGPQQAFLLVGTAFIAA